MSQNIMQSPKIEKVVVNIGVGESGEKLITAEKLLETLTNRKPARTVSKHKIPTWNLKKGEPVGCKVTLRGSQADEFLKKSFYAKDNTISSSSFDNHGNFSFGISEYIDFKDMKYDPDIGIFGMDVCVTMERPGYSVKRRKLKKGRITKRISKEESVKFIKEKFGVEIE